ncbi:ATP-binding protein [Actinoplanes sp. TBRC 11911]|uniref:ATP/GTP-binding protein n=1 Tax=Actinoplanes sp. TBRC 11911 TaxID=2729386 RepID=UPI00145F4FDA|nr:ATP/GTP-binding protein [Actinoplanes sp. TBRC 11911]NMO52755.1 ATP-binding protein [Actinoplanes sp. TBRC 11911]
MIVWINGAFGAGKTTTAGLLAAGLADAKVFDPEYVGYLLRAFVTSPTGDFQDIPLWRHLVVETLAGLDRSYPRTWVVPMSLIDAGYRAEIFEGSRAAGAGVREFVLVVPSGVLRARILSDEVDTEARQWRLDHVEQALATFAAAQDACLIDGTREPEKVAAEIIERLA